VRTGIYISGIAHLALIGWVILGAALNDNAKPPEMQVTEVSIISKAAFDALQSQLPDATTDVTPPLAQPDTGKAPRTPASDTLPPRIRKADAPPPQDQPVAPDLGAIRRNARPDVQIDAPEIAPQPTVPDPGATLVMPVAPIAPRDSAGLSMPRKLAKLPPAEAPSPRIDTTPAPKPPTDAKKAPEVQKSTRPDKNATTPAKPKVETAPDQASTEIVTEAKKRKKTAAPLRSSRPRGRPANLAEKARRAAAQDIAAALAAAQAGAPTPPAPQQPAPAPKGPPLTGREKDALRLAMQKCWNVNPSAESARITVVVSVSMSPDGKPRPRTIKMKSATQGSKSAQQSAFNAARRAILRCGVKGYKLPVEKYESWRNIEITFNPEKMRNR